MSTNDTQAEVCSSDGLGLEPAAHVRWHQQNGWDVTELSGLRGHPEIEAFWESRRKLALYTADQVRAAVAAERERCAKLCDAKADHCDAAENYYGANAARDLADAIREA